MTTKRPAPCARVLPRGALFPPQDSDAAQVREHLHHTCVSPQLWGLPRSRWRLHDLSLLCPYLLCLSPSGVWRRLHKWRLGLRRTRVHLTSPDAHYREKVAWLGRVQEAAARGEVVLIYGDEHTFYRQPLSGRVWHRQGGGGSEQPRCYHHTSSNTKRRTVAGLNACTGQVTWHGCSRSRIKELQRFLEKLRYDYGQQRIVLVWDNWPVHLHPKVLECATQQNIELV